MAKIAIFLCSILLMIGQLAAQDTLPKFSVSTKGNNRILISWANTYPTIKQISIQRSSDSLKNFKTILSLPDPSIPQNGFVDTKAPTSFVFYRIFIVLDSGKYVFTESKRPFWDTARITSGARREKNEITGSKQVIYSDSASATEAKRLTEKNDPPPVTIIPEKFYTVKRLDTVLYQVSEKLLRRFRDSVVTKTKDTLVFRPADTILIKPFIPKEVFKPSIYVFTEKDGNISLKLPEANSKHYSVKFFDEKSNPLFEVNKIADAILILDKSNFLHAGWFRFELYEDGKLKEKNKFFIPKDF